MTSPNELLIGKIALQKGLITRAQLDECVRLQESSASPMPPIGQILVGKGYLTSAQLDEVLSAQQVTMKAPYPNYQRDGQAIGNWETIKREDVLFGKLAVKHGMANPDQLNETLRIQDQMHQRGVGMRLGQLLVKKGYMTPEQVKQALDIQRKCILTCPKCGKNYNVRNYIPGRQVFCPTCSMELRKVEYEHTIDASATAQLPAIPQTAEDRKFSGEEFGPTIATQSGTRVARYELLELLGAGGMGKVYKAWDRQLKRMVALKQLISEDPSDKSQIERFVRESQAAAKLEHPNIVQVYDVGEHAGRHYFTMRFVDGLPLNKLAHSDKKPPMRRCVEIVRDVARALDYAHQQGVIHRDVKPHNIIMDSRGTPFVMDFGLARDVSAGGKAKLSMTGDMMGTPSYMSPEHTRGNPKLIGAPADQFSLGVTLYELITGRLPFSGKSMLELMKAIAESDPPRPSQLRRTVQKDLETICLKALDKEPLKRYANLGAMADDLERFLNDEPITACPISTTERLWRKAKKHRTVVLTTAVAGVICLAVLVGLIVSSIQKRSRLQGNIRSAREQLALRNYKQAKECLVVAKEIDPKNEDVLALLVEVEDKLRAVETAQRLEMDQAIASKKKAETEKTLLEDNQRRRDKALAVLKSADIAVKEATIYLYRKGTLDQMRKELHAVMPTFEEAIRLDPDLPDSYWCRGRAFEYLFDSVKALENYSLAIEKDKDFALALVDRGRLHLEKYEILRTQPGLDEESAKQQAQPWLEKARADLGKAHQQTAISLGRLEMEAELVEVMCEAAEGKAEKAVLRCDESIRKYGEQAGGVEVFFRLKGLALLDAGRNNDARDAFTRAIEIRPNFPEAFLSRGIARAGEKDLEGAIADCDEALKINPGYHEAFLNRGVLRRMNGDIEGAISDYDEALRIDPAQAMPFYNRALARNFKNDIDGAIADYTEAIKKDPRFASAFFNRANARKAKGDLNGAIADYTEVIKINPRFAAALTNRGLVRFSQGDIDKAMSDYNEALKLEPKSVEALLNRGILRAHMRDYDGAIADYDAAIVVDPAYAEAFLVRAEARAEKGDIEGAVADYGTALKVAPQDWPYRKQAEEAQKLLVQVSTNPRDATAFYARATLRLNKGNVDGAMADLNEAIKINPNYAEALNDRGLLYKNKGDLKAAIADLNEALKIRPRYAQAFLNRGLVKRAAGDVPGAIVDYDQAINIDPRLVSAYVNRAVAKQSKGDLNGAILDCDRAIQIDPAHASAYSNRGLARRAKGDTKGAISDYDKAIQLDPKIVAVYVNRSAARLVLGEYTGAISDCDAALRIEPTNALAYGNRGSAKGESGDLAGAIADFNKAIEFDPNYLQGYLNRGLAYQTQGNAQAAISDYEKVLEMAPANWPLRKRVEAMLRAARQGR